MSRTRSNQSNVACKSRSFQSPWPNMKAYGREGFAAGRSARKRVSSSNAIGKRIICSTLRIITVVSLELEAAFQDDHFRQMGTHS